MQSLFQPSNRGISSLENASSQEHLLVRITLSNGDMILDTFAMLDAGATNSYIDTSFARKHNIPLKKSLVLSM